MFIGSVTDDVHCGLFNKLIIFSSKGGIFQQKEQTRIKYFYVAYNKTKIS